MVGFDSTYSPGTNLVLSDGYRLHSYLKMGNLSALPDSVLPDSAVVVQAELVLVQATRPDTIFGIGPKRAGAPTWPTVFCSAGTATCACTTWAGGSRGSARRTSCICPNERRGCCGRARYSDFSAPGPARAPAGEVPGSRRGSAQHAR